MLEPYFEHDKLTFIQDKPELLEASLEKLASSFNRADWVAEANETSV